MPEPVEAPTAQVNIDNAETVNVPAQGGHLPYAWMIATVSMIILICFAGVTWWVLSSAKESGIDAATKGSIIQTWNNLAMLAASFWVGSSIAGKLATGSAPKP